MVVESLERAVALWEAGNWTAPDGPTFVTLDGDVLDAAGVMTGGTTGGLLQRRREIQELEQQQAKLVHAREQQAASIAQLTSEREVLIVQRQQLEVQIGEAEQARMAALVKEREVREASLAEL
ncbi:MAG: hypothetical protein ACKO9T_04950, partial [Nitrospira sp.]